MGEWVKIAAAGTATTSGTVAPGNVTGLSGSYRYTDPNSNNERQLELIVSFTPPSPLGTFVGVAAYYEDLDQSDGGTLLLDGTTDLDGSNSLDGEWNPKPGGRFTDSPAILRLTTPIVRQRKIRVYLASYSTEIENKLARATAGGPTPNVLITVDPFAEFPLGIEYVPLAKNFAFFGSAPDYSDYDDSGARMWSIGASWSEPDVDPRYDLIGGYFIVLEYASSLHRERPSGFLPRTQLSWQSDRWPVPASAEVIRLWLVTFRQDGRENSIIPGVTPMLEFTVQPQVGASGLEHAGLVTGFIVTVEYSLDADGSEVYRLKFTWVAPDDPRFGGVHFVYDDGARRWGADYSGSPEDTEFTTGWFPVPSTGGTFDAWGVSIDRSARENSIVDGTTPKQSVTISPQTTGKIPGGRIDPTTLHGSLAVVLGQLAVAAGGITTDRLANLAVEAAKIATGAVVDTKIFDGAVGTAKLADLAVTTAKINDLAVNSAKIGNAAVGSAAIANLAVGTAHIQDAAITNAKIASLEAGKITAGTITASVSMTAPTLTITSGTVTVNIDATNKVKVSDSSVSSFVQIGGASITVGVSSSYNLVASTSQLEIKNASGNRTVRLSGGPNPGAMLLSDNGNDRVSLSANGNGTIALFNSSNTQRILMDANVGDIDVATNYKVGGQTVVGPRRSSIADVTGSAGVSYGSTEQTMINDLKAAVNTIITRLEDHGLIDTV